MTTVSHHQRRRIGGLLFFVLFLFIIYSPAFWAGSGYPMDLFAKQHDESLVCSRALSRGSETRLRDEPELLLSF